MSGALQTVGAGLAAALLALVLRQTKPEMALPFSLAVGVMLLLPAADRLREIVLALRALAEESGLRESAGLLARVAGIGVLCELGGHLCRDAGEGGLGEKVELGGKIMMLSLALPVAVSLLRAVLGLLA